MNIKFIAMSTFMCIGFVQMKKVFIFIYIFECKCMRTNTIFDVEGTVS